LSAERSGNGTPGKRADLRSSGSIIAPGRQAMLPRDAFFANTRTVPAVEAVGEVSAELVIPYPPGIPVLAPGDIIEAERIEFLLHGAARGMHLSGPADPHLNTINIVADLPPFT
jgi:lysine decarboxylase